MVSRSLSGLSDTALVGRLRAAVNAEAGATTKSKRTAARRRISAARHELGHRLLDSTDIDWSSIGIEPTTDRRKRGSGSIYPRDDGWMAAVKINGKRVRRTFKSEDDARAWLDDIAAGRSIESTEITVTEWLTARLDIWETSPGRRGRPLRQATMRNHRGAVDRWWIPRLGGHRLVDLRRSQVESVIREMSAAGLGGNSIRINTQPLVKALNEAVLDELIPSNPARSLTPTVDRTESDHLTPDEARTLLARADESKHGTAITLALLTGLRRGELLGLCWDAIDLDARTLRVVRQVTKEDGQVRLEDGTKTGGKGVRTVTLSAQAVETIERASSARESDAPTGLLFPAPGGGPLAPDTFTKATTTLTRNVIGRPIGPHGLRHSFTSLMAAAGVPIKVIQVSLGHTTPTMTLGTYVHTDRDQHTAAASALDDLLRPAPLRAVG